MLAHDLGDGVAPLLRHHRSERRLQRRHAEHHAGAGFGEGTIERFRHQAVLVGLDAVQAILVLGGEGDHARIGEAFGEDDIAGRDGEAERDRNRVLPAMSDEELIGIGGDAE